MMQQTSVPFEFPNATSGASEGLGFTRVNGPIRDDAQGELIPTGNPLDLAIEGKGTFEIRGIAGIERTRNGRFQIDSSGNLVTSQGFPVLNEQGQNVRIDPGKIVEIAPNGDIHVGETQDGVFSRQGKIRIVDENGTVLNNKDYQIRQRHLEMSNVNPVEEMVKMLDQMRCHDSYMKLIKGFADLEEKAATELGRL
jgi:flagellar hook-basal body protein